MSRCPDWTDLLVDRALGNLAPAERERLETHLAGCAACRAEAAAFGETVHRLRAATALKPSPSFRALLERRLDRVDEEEAAPLPLRGGERWHYRWHLLVHRVRNSPNLQIQLAAALLVVALGLFIALWPRSAAPAPRDPVAQHYAPPPPPEEPGAGVVPPSRPRDIVEEQVARSPVEELEGFVPESVTAEEELLPEADPRLRERDRVVRDSGSRAPPEPRAAPLPVRDPAATAPPQRFPASLAGVDDSVRRSLAWMARQQRADGSFAPGGGEPGLEVATTAAAALAFLSAGHLGDSPSRQDQVVRRALTFVVGRIGSDGRVQVGVDDPEVAMLDLSLACLALTEQRLLLAPALPGLHPAEVERLENALDHLQGSFQQIYRGGPSSRLRAAGENAAWASLALVTARRSRLPLRLPPFGDDRVAAMLRRLQAQDTSLNTALNWVSEHAVMAMFSPDLAPGKLDQVEVRWRQAIEPILEEPRQAPVGLRFLVSSALCPWGTASGMNRALWDRFQGELERGVMTCQVPEFGYFRGNRGAFQEGTVLQTALATLTLQVPRRAERLQAAVER